MLLRILPLLRLMRPEQYVKGVAIIVGAAASGLMFEPGNQQRLLLAIVSFSLCSSLVYIVNDLQDVATDRMHPKKKFRPLASGKVSKSTALTMCLILLTLTALLATRLDLKIQYCLLIYIIINIFYSFIGKHLVVLELLIVASGFVLRGLVGVYSVGAEPSMWFNLLAMFASLLLVSGKRLAEKNNANIRTSDTRSSVQQYSLEYLTSLRTVSISGLLMTYFLMIENKIQLSNAPNYSFILQVSLLPYIFCVLALGFFLSGSDLEEPHSIFFKFKPLLIGAIVWACTYGYAIYGMKL
jgi:decaprenyl-phosphate phosphoribosyltransferase